MEYVTRSELNDIWGDIVKQVTGTASETAGTIRETNQTVKEVMTEAKTFARYAKPVAVVYGILLFVKWSTDIYLNTREIQKGK